MEKATIIGVERATTPVVTIDGGYGYQWYTGTLSPGTPPRLR
jgi:hypothetical protein